MKYDLPLDSHAIDIYKGLIGTSTDAVPAFTVLP